VLAGLYHGTQSVLAGLYISRKKSPLAEKCQKFNKHGVFVLFIDQNSGRVGGEW
jgi:hypothetical protein